MKPIASSTRSASISNSAAGDRHESHAAALRAHLHLRPRCSAVTRPCASPMKRSSRPSRAARRLPRAPTRRGRSFGHSGHGLSAARASGGRGSSSSWCTDRAPWRCAVPRQSAPVSPPPMMTTCLSFGGDELLVGSIASPSQRRFCWRQVVHREVDALQLAARAPADRAARRAAGEDDGVELAPQRRRPARRRRR